MPVSQSRPNLRRARDAIPADRAITRHGAPFVILGQKKDNGHTIAAVDPQLRRQFTLSRSFDKTQVDLSGISLNDSVNQRALFDAIAAPDAAENQNLHFPHKAAHKLSLGIGESGGLRYLTPAALLLVGTGLKVTVVGQPACKLFRKEGSFHHSYGSILIHCCDLNSTLPPPRC